MLAEMRLHSNHRSLDNLNKKTHNANRIYERKEEFCYVIIIIDKFNFYVIKKNKIQ